MRESNYERPDQEQHHMLKDPFGRTIDYLRISVTDKCNYRCTYCMPAGGIPEKSHSQILRYEEIACIVCEAARLGISRIRITGGEPLVKRDLEHLVSQIAKTDGIAEVAMTTNAALLTPRKARTLKEAGLSRLNISLDTLDARKFSTITRGGKLEDVLNGIDAARRAGFHPIKINMVIFEDTQPADIEEMRGFCSQSNLILQTIRHFSLYDRDNSAAHIATDRPPGCASCNRLRLTADGFWKPCLFSDNELHVDLSRIRQNILQAVAMKPENGASCRNRKMSQIGG